MDQSEHRTRWPQGKRVANGGSVGNSLAPGPTAPTPNRTQVHSRLNLLNVRWQRRVLVSHCYPPRELANGEFKTHFCNVCPRWRWPDIGGNALGPPTLTPCFYQITIAAFSFVHSSLIHGIPGTCVQYPGLQGGGALGDALTQGTPAGSLAASAHGGTYSHVAVVGGASGGDRGAASATAAAAVPAGVARRPQARPSLRRAAHLRAVGWRPTRRTGGRVALIAARRGA